MIELSNLAAVLRAHAVKAEENDRLSTEAVEALRENGLFALRTPGDGRAGIAAVARLLTEAGRACPSSAWVAGTCATAKTLVANAVGGAEAFADPDVLFCGSGIPGGRGEPVAGGVRLTGRWPNVSGCEDAVWAVLGVMVDGVFSFVLVPTADLVVEPTWRMAGMRGTGSHTLVADDVLVPQERTAPAHPFAPNDRILFAMTALGPVVGAAQGALDAVTAMFASDRKPFMTSYTRMGESPGARHWLAEAAHLVQRAETAMLTAAEEADERELSAEDLPRLYRTLAGAGKDCRDAVDLMLDLHGTSGFDTANVLQRFWRDVAVGSRHPHLNSYLAVENLGTALAG
ncbi:Acyl-CoA dehydrogenase [Lentzea fradiae]|uniref:Acyl-CoA dehydrogenase n=1 Tax=Lentzea fradiae TaxID=200378 RepID=A0A1G7VNK8_9PSEU|nr:acyl-CoA dehydrogenase family protein [Lentzea fradiae]SDG61314.1 Acyl-CoA dehydrogenase [Lentzea fradiae]